MLFKNVGIIDEDFGYKPDMYVGVEDDRITYIGSEAPQDAEHFGTSYDGRDKVLMSGFYNAHGHSPMSLMRGYGENLPLDKWLNDRIFPFEAKLYGDAVYWATLMTMAESARFGIVSTTDMYYFTDDMVKAISQAKMKSNISRAVTNFGAPVSESIAFKEMTDAVKNYHGYDEGRILTDVSAHAEYTNDIPMIEAIAAAGKEFGVRAHIHLSETEKEHRECIERHGKTPAGVFLEAGLFDVPTTAAHCVWVTEEDLDIFKEKGVTVASNPVSNMKLASGMCKVVPMYEKGINVAIGTDSSASNNSLNFIEEMKIFALTGKVTSGDAAAMAPEQVLRSASRAGALSQGREDCGLIKEGFKADMIAVDVSGPNMCPADDMPNDLIFSADGKDICLTMVDGKVIYKDGEYTTIDIEKAAFETIRAKQKILSCL